MKPDLTAIKNAAYGRWPEIHAALGIPAKLLNTRKHQPCPHCGGKDRYTDHKHGGGYICNQCAPEGENTHYAVTARAGWHGTAYILPSGEVIRPDNAEAGRVIYNGDTSQAPAYEAAGTAQEWNAEIGQYLTGNSRLTF